MSKSRLRCILQLLAAFLLTVCWVHSQDVKKLQQVVQGTVTDVDGNPVVGAVVSVKDGWTGAALVSTLTDRDGLFTFEKVAPGSHLLTAAFLSLFNIPPVSFHMSKTVSTLDVAASSISAEQLENIERFANEIIFEYRPVHVC